MAHTDAVKKPATSSPEKSQNNHQQTDDSDTLKVDIKQKLSAHVHYRMLNSIENSTGNGNTGASEEPKLSTPIKTECGTIESGVQKQTVTDDADGAGGAQPPNPGGSFMAGSLVLSNSILDEVLNEKKLELLQSSEVIKVLQEKCKQLNK